VSFLVVFLPPIRRTGRCKTPEPANVLNAFGMMTGSLSFSLLPWPWPASHGMLYSFGPVFGRLGYKPRWQLLGHFHCCREVSCLLQCIREASARSPDPDQRISGGFLRWVFMSLIWDA
jgi:hypothetical protein